MSYFFYYYTATLLWFAVALGAVMVDSHGADSTGES